MTEFHVVFGAGPLGIAVVSALRQRKKRVRLVSYSGKKNGVPEGVEVARGDATKVEDCVQLCQGASHVYNCTNPRDYHKWPEQFPPLQNGVLEGAARSGAKLIVLENLYMYGPHGGVVMTEDTPMLASGPRGSTRKTMTEALFAAHREGKVRVTSARASDFYGSGVVQSLIGKDVFANIVQGKGVTLAANPKLQHTVSYIGDVGEALVRLGEEDKALGRAWHISNAPAITLEVVVAMIQEEVGQKVKVTYLPKALTRVVLPIMGLFVPPVRGLAENSYQTYEPFVVDDSQYKAAFGDHATPLRQGIRTTVTWYQHHFNSQGLKPDRRNATEETKMS
jgi:nucleoside-diphosphate-sugar epimerase